MMKSTTFLGLLLTAPALSGCAVEPGDITDVARELAAADRTNLDLKPGEYLVYSQAATETAQELRLEADGTVTVGEGGATTESARTTVQKVIARARIQSTEADGFVMAEVSQMTKQTEIVDGDVTNLTDFTPERAEYHLYAADGWVRRIDAHSDSDEDSAQGIATYPLNPRPGDFYVDDRGDTYEAVKKPVSVSGTRAVKLVQHAKASTLAIEELFSECYEIVEAESGIPDNLDIRPRLDRNCFGPDGFVTGTFTHRADTYRLVGSQLVLRDRVYEETYIVESIWCGAPGDEFPFAAGPLGTTLEDCHPDAEVYFTGAKVTRDETTELVKRAVSTDAETLPEIADAAE